MIRHLVQAVFILSFLVFSAPALAAPRSAIALFPNEVAAMRHCPGDTIVWLNTPTRIYHFKGERWYGHTKRGAYVQCVPCRQRARSHNGPRAATATKGKNTMTDQFGKAGLAQREILQAIEDVLVDTGFDEMMWATERGTFKWQRSPKIVTEKKRLRLGPMPRRG